MSSMPTSLANGRYQLGQLIGRGGMAEVHVALDTRLGRTVAVKIMRADLANDDIFLTRFRREALSVAQMNNPNIVNIYDSGEEVVLDDNGRSERLPYLIMEYVKGQTLRDIIKVNGPLSQRDAEQVMMGVLSALEYSHRMGIIHRDIKPGNIMISDQGQVKVMDFGIARALDDSAATMTQSQGVVGTAQYLSPEQARGESVDMRSDLYSAGCVLYEMLTGRPPFTGDSAVAIAYQHVSEVATPPSAVVPGLPKMWDSICAKAMAKDRQNRYATATEFRGDILTFMNGGVPVAAAFNPLTDLANMKARKQAEQASGTGGTFADSGAPTQAFNPITGQFEAVETGRGMAMDGLGGNVMTRAQQRAQAAKAKRRKQIIIGTLLGLVLVVLVGLGIVAALGGGSSAQMATVPTITPGSTWTEAQVEQKIKAAGFRFERMTDNDSTEPEGSVTKQDPAGGTQAAKDSVVKVWFSAGPQNTRIPDVSNRTQEEAREILEEAGFKVKASVNTENSDTIENGKVTRTDPAANTSRPKGDRIQLYVSNGMTVVPNVVGQTKEQAIQTLHDHGNLIPAIQEEHSDLPAGQVTRIEPEVNSPIAQGSSVNIWISSGKEQVSVPSCSTYDTYSSCKAKLEAVGLVAAPAGAGENGTFVSMNPGAGTTVDKGSTVTITTQSAVTPPDPEEPGDGGNGNGDTDTNER